MKLALRILSLLLLLSGTLTQNGEFGTIVSVQAVEVGRRLCSAGVRVECVVFPAAAVGAAAGRHVNTVFRWLSEEPLRQAHSC